MITLKDYDYTCGDGCCSWYGVDIFRDGERLNDVRFMDSNQVSSVLEVLEIEHEIISE